MASGAAVATGTMTTTAGGVGIEMDEETEVRLPVQYPERTYPLEG
jgi:hypothetical protein